ncbi:MAG: hypothetical protein RLZZ611_81 [Cyanobacteriota bacterium]|jgi:hypothetical protein
MAGFSLVETLVSLSLGLTVAGSILQALFWQEQMNQGLTRLMRERSLQERTLTLIAADVARAQRISASPQSETAACPLAGRLPVLHLDTTAGPITYSLGDAPSAIWRGKVLMRCGPAFNLEGELTLGSEAQNRVVLDGLPGQATPWTGCASLLSGEAGSDLAGSAGHGFSACVDAQGLLVGLRLEQEIGSSNRTQRITSERLASRTP